MSLQTYRLRILQGVGNPVFWPVANIWRKIIMYIHIQLYKWDLVASQKLLPPYRKWWGRVEIDRPTPLALFKKISEKRTGNQAHLIKKCNVILQKFGISSFEQNWQPENSVFLVFCLIKGNIFWEGHKILQNLHLTFDWHYIGQT